MNADIKECTDAGHIDAPHHHRVNGARAVHSTLHHCPGCSFGAPLYQRTLDMAAQVRNLVAVAKASEVFDASRDLPDDWADHVAIVRKLTREELAEMKKAPEGHVLVWLDGAGALRALQYDMARQVELLDFTDAYLLPIEVQA